MVDVMDHQLIDLFAKYKATVRSAQLPTLDFIVSSGRALGFNITARCVARLGALLSPRLIKTFFCAQGGREHNQPITISRVDPGAAPSMSYMAAQLVWPN